ncbi:MAG: PAS domain S-box protein, partial [Euryarchaeota archaeon]|nr:PAS domain S-box protein [Euryarchaeota archaeon]
MDKLRSDGSKNSFEIVPNFLSIFSDAALLMDTDGIILAFNDAAAERFSSSKDTLVGKCAYDATPADVAKIQRKWMKEVASSRAPIHAEALHEGRRFRVSLYPLTMRNGSVTRVLMLGHDVTKQGDAIDEKLRLAMLDAANDAIVIFDLDGHIRYWNRGAERQYGWKQEDVRGEVIHSLLKTVFPSSFENVTDRLFHAGQWEGELKHTTRAGVVITVMSNMTLQYDEQNVPAAILETTRDITDRKQAEERLRAVSLYSRSLIEASLDPFVTINAAGKITDVNKATEEVTGHSRHELIGSDFSSYFTEPEKANAGYRQVFSDGYVRDYPLAIRHKSGKITDVLYHATLYKNDLGEIQGVFAAARDITDRKQAEEKLRAASLYARSLIEASLDPLVTISADGKITDANKATEDVTGYARDELIGSDFSDFFTEPEVARRGYLQVFADGFVKDYAMAIQNKSGSITDVMYNATLYRDEEGEVQGVFAAARDVTELKRAEEELQRYFGHLEALVDERTARLKESEQQFRTLVETANNIILTADTEGKFTFINDYGARFFGYTPDELIGQDVIIIVPEVESTGRPLKPLVTNILTSPADYPISLNENVTKDGRRVWIQWANESLIDRDGQHIGHLAIGIDFSELKKTEEALKNAERLAGIGETAAMIGHDLRNPLQVLQYVVDLQRLRIERTPPEQRGPDDWERESQLFEKISEQVFYMNKIVGDLQDFARPIVPEKEEVDIKGLIEDVVRSLPPADGVRIEMQIPNLQVIADPHFLHRVFANLILNAIQAMPGGGKLNVSAFSEDGAIAVCVSDTGTGIQEDFKDKLFKPLFTGKAKGTGLGLAVVKRIVEAHGGDIFVESEVGKGS